MLGLGVLAVGLAALIPVAFGDAQPVLFGAATNYSIARGNAMCVAIGDLNGDGKPDLAVANLWSGVSVLLGTGAGAFGAATDFAVGYQPPISVVIGDLNGDGKPDLATASGRDGAVGVVLGVGDGSFGPTTRFFLGDAYFIAIGDLNSDGKLDVAVTRPYYSTVAVLLGTGTGSFGAATNYAVGSGPGCVAIGDLNGDGKPDLATANELGTVSVLLGTGTGAFGAAANLAVGGTPYSVAIDDLNGDGKPDLAVANGNVSILLGTGTGAFGAATNFAVGGSASSVAIGDLNGDGKPDLAVAKATGYERVSVLLGTGSGAFGAATSFTVPGSPQSVAIGDLNGDGEPDLAVANAWSANVSVLLHTQTARVIAPANVVQECDDEAEAGAGTAVNLVFDVTPGSADLLRVRDMTGGRTLLEVSNPAQQDYGVSALFPHGLSTVLIELLRGSTVLASASVAVQIDDTTAPVLTGCAPRTIELQGPQTTLAPSLLGIAVVDTCDPAPVVSFAPAALGLGTTSVSATARDATGNTSTCTFDVTVLDTTPPYFTVCPDDIERACTGVMTLVGFDVLAGDLSGAASVSCADGQGRSVSPAGTLFAVGSHTVTCTARDASGNAATCSFLVTILDDDAPVLVCPGDVTVGNDAGTCFASVSFTVTATDECDPGVAIVCTAPWGEVESGDAFPVGLTQVDCTARDFSGNEATCSFGVLVEDREAPVLTAPSIARLVTDCAGTPITVAPSDLGASARDNCDGHPILICSPSSLDPGTTDVVVTATDQDGNASSLTISVTVLRGAFTCQVLQPLDGNVDNLIRAGQTVQLKVKVACQNVFDADVNATVEKAELMSGTGTPIANETVDDSGAPNDDDTTMRLANGFYIYNLSTRGWPTTSGARFRVTMKFSKAGHVDTFCDVILKNR